HHVFRDIYRNKFLPVVYGNGVPDEVGNHRRAARPGPHYRFLILYVQTFHLLDQVVIRERSFFSRSTHSFVRVQRAACALCAPFDSLPSLSTFLCLSGHDPPIRPLIVTSFEAARRLAPRRDRMASAGSFSLTAAVWVIDRIHRNAAIVRTAPQPAVAAGFA